MQVILKERLEHLGNAGDVVTVKPGYARNYLVPKGLAYEANEANLKRIAREREVAARQEAEAVAAARESAKAIEGLSVTFTARAGEEGKLFGSITSSDIAEKLALVITGRADDALLDRYERQRRPIALAEILAQADRNRARMREQDPEKRRAILRDMQALTADRDRLKAHLLRTSMIDGVRQAAKIQ